MILSDEEISTYVTRMDFIHPFIEKQLTPNGYDVSIEDVDLLHDSICLKDGVFTIPKQSAFIVLTKERVTLPYDVVGRLSIKTSYARKGLILSPGVVDAGFSGKLNLCFFNAGNDAVSLEKGKTIVQLVFEKMAKGSLKAYAERSGHYQHQDKIIK